MTNGAAVCILIYFKTVFAKNAHMCIVCAHSLCTYLYSGTKMLLFGTNPCMFYAYQLLIRAVLQHCPQRLSRCQRSAVRFCCAIRHRRVMPLFFALRPWRQSLFVVRSFGPSTHRICHSRSIPPRQSSLAVVCFGIHYCSWHTAAFS